ncbi:hypothetical protein [Kitasatospora sp. NPDC004531]
MEHRLIDDSLCLWEIRAFAARRRDEKGTADTADRHDRKAAAITARLAADCGLSGAIPGGTAVTATAPSAERTWCTAMLWNPATVSPVPRIFRPLGAREFHHGVTTFAFDVGAAEQLPVASYHGSPFRPDRRANGAIRLKGLQRRSGGARPAAILGYFNPLSAAQVLGPDGRMGSHDAEPYTDQAHDDLEYQCVAETVGTGNVADRRQSPVLLRDGFAVDAAAHLGAPWQPSSGHWPTARAIPTCGRSPHRPDPPRPGRRARPPPTRSSPRRPARRRPSTGRSTPTSGRPSSAPPARVRDPCGSS